VLVAAIPELRGAFLHHRVFLSPATERFDLALAGLASALVTRRRAALLLALPWCAELLRDVRRAGAAAAAGRAAADTVTFAALAAGSLRRRTPVL
jgi:hypothetical protein